MLILARHGQSEANASGLLVGRADSPLTDLGCRQADAIGAILSEGARTANRPLGRVISSPLGRAVATAERIAAAQSAGAGGRPDVQRPTVEIDERLTELDYGELDLLPTGGVDPGMWKAWRSDPAFRPPRGESLEELAERVRSVMTELVPQYAAAGAAEDAVVVSHASPIKAMIADVLGAGVHISWRMSLSVASISRIGPGPGGGGPVLVSFNETWHLSGL
jgi:broad specificity phosphatase PhoE